MYPNASKEPLDVIELNECKGTDSLVTARFQACFNEIERLRDSLQNIAAALHHIKAIVTAEDGAEVQPHDYIPSWVHMGDCAICGHLRESVLHTKEKAP